MRKPPGRAYQELVASIMKAFDPGARVESGEWVEGPDGRLDMDVSVRGMFNGRPSLAVIECKDFDLTTTGKVGRPYVDALDSKRLDLGADFALICSNSGFTSDALRKAKRKRIGMISALRAGDKRVKIRIEEEIYFRKVRLGPMTFSYTGRNIDRKLSVTAHDVKYNGRSVDAWLQQRAALIALADPTVSELITAKFRLRGLTFFQVKGNPIILESLSISFRPSTQWFAQVIQLDAALGIYDYLRGRIKLVGGTNQYIIKGVDFDAGSPIDFTPNNTERGVGLMPGEVHVDMAMVEGLDVEADSDIPNLDSLFLPQDLAMKWPRAI